MFAMTRFSLFASDKAEYRLDAMPWNWHGKQCRIQSMPSSPNTTISSPPTPGKVRRPVRRFHFRIESLWAFRALVGIDSTTLDQTNKICSHTVSRTRAEGKVGVWMDLVTVGGGEETFRSEHYPLSLSLFLSLSPLILSSSPRLQGHNNKKTVLL